MQGICINSDLSAVMQEKEKYYLFDCGPNNFYVSRFDNEKSHFGSYQREYFKLIDDEQPKPIKHIAEVERSRGGFAVGQRYIIGPASNPKNKGYYNVYLLDGGIVATLKTNIFKIIEPYEEPEIVIHEKQSETVQIEPIAPTVINTLVEVKKTDGEPKKKVKKANKDKSVIPDGQMDIFELLGG